MSSTFDPNTTYKAIIAAAKGRGYITYGELAAANGTTFIPPLFGLLGDFLKIAKLNGWPLFTAIVVKKIHKSTGILEGKSRNGFIEPAQKLGYDIGDEEEFYRKHQEMTFAWAHKAPESIDAEIVSTHELAVSKDIKIVRFFGPILDALRESGGTANRKDVIEMVKITAGLSEDELVEPAKDGSPVYKKRVVFARNWLEDAGLIKRDNPGDGVWSLTEEGADTFFDTYEEAYEFYRSGGQEKKKAPPPNWLEEEMILVLDLYLANRECPNLPIDVRQDYAEICSTLLGQRNIAGQGARNANAIRALMMNFKSLDPVWQAQGMAGLSKPSEMARNLWSELSESPEVLAVKVAEIRKGILDNDNPSTPGPSVRVHAKLEGGRRLESHRRIERRSQRAEKLKQSHDENGTVTCEVCGTIGEGYSEDLRDSTFEVHHRVPLAEVSETVATELDDLAVLCANCHRAIHALPDVLPVDAFRESGHVRPAKKS